MLCGYCMDRYEHIAQLLIYTSFHLIEKKWLLSSRLTSKWGQWKKYRLQD